MYQHENSSVYLLDCEQISPSCSMIAAGIETESPCRPAQVSSVSISIRAMRWTRIQAARPLTQSLQIFSTPSIRV